MEMKGLLPSFEALPPPSLLHATSAMLAASAVATAIIFRIS
jgi:hypothetical protein